MSTQKKMFELTGVISKLPWCYNTEELAEVLGVHKQTVQIAAKKGQFPSIQIGNRYRFPFSVILPYLQAEPVSQNSTEYTRYKAGHDIDIDIVAGECRQETTDPDPGTEQ